eukprot:334725-Chlamydomonas_euryale.AAC.5
MDWRAFCSTMHWRASCSTVLLVPSRLLLASLALINGSLQPPIHTHASAMPLHTNDLFPATCSQSGYIRLKNITAPHECVLPAVPHPLACRDDVADHAKWASHFNAKRILHELEVQASTADVEVKLQGDGPWDLDGRPLQMRRIGGAAQPPPGSQIVHTPGHSTGSICVWYEPQKAMFTGASASLHVRRLTPHGHVRTDIGPVMMVFVDVAYPIVFWPACKRLYCLTT